MAKRKILDSGKIMSLALRGCTLREIATEMECSHDTLQRHYKKELTAGREKYNIAIRAALFDEGINKRNSKILIHLSKAILKNAETLQIAGDPNNPIKTENKLIIQFVDPNNKDDSENE